MAAAVAAAASLAKRRESLTLRRQALRSSLSPRAAPAGEAYSCTRAVPPGDSSVIVCARLPSGVDCTCSWQRRRFPPRRFPRKGEFGADGLSKICTVSHDTVVMGLAMEAVMGLAMEAVMAAVVMAAKGRSVDGGGDAGVVDASGDAPATTVAFFAALFAARRATSDARRHAPKLSKPLRCHNSIADQYLSPAGRSRPVAV